MGHKRHYDHDLIRRLHDEGMTRENIAMRVGCSLSTISYVIYNIKESRRRAALVKKFEAMNDEEVKQVMEILNKGSRTSNEPAS